MKRLCGLILFSLALAACNQAPPAPVAKTDEQPGKPANAAADDTASGDSNPAFKPQTHRLISSEEVPLLEQINRENERVVAAAMPSVVRVTAMSPVDPQGQMFNKLPFHIPGLPHGVHPAIPSYGSGVIISKDGYLVTNAHVVTGAQTVEVQMHDQRVFPAKVVAADDDADIAVLKIAATDLPALPWGNSDKVEVGEQVFAIGNPFDLEDSVSRGIISAKGRNLPDAANFDDYFQTDAAINVGNSGGALVNIHGELIGINSAIASFTKGNEGVGFSIPSNAARRAVEGLLKNGRLVRGYLGVQLPSKIDEGVVELLGLEPDHGALLAGILAKSPADDARLRSVDFITEVDGHKISGIVQLRMVVSQIPVGKEVAVNYIRAGSPHSTKVKIGEIPKLAAPTLLQAPLDPAPDSAEASNTVYPHQGVLTGVSVTDLTDKTRKKFGVEDMVTSGVVVTEVGGGSPADDKGLERGDVIEMACAQHGSIRPLATSADFTGLAKKLADDQSVALLVHHGKLSGQADRSSIFVFLAPVAK